MSKHNEMTRHAFISNMADFMNKLVTEPLKADTSEFLKSHGITAPVAIKILTKRADPNDENSAILIKSTKIKDNGYDENGKRLKDSFIIKYSKYDKDNKIRQKMRDLYISLFESNIIDKCPINEDGEGGNCGAFMSGMGGATTCDASSGQVFKPSEKKNNINSVEPIKRKTLYITQEQINLIKQKLNEDCPSVVDTQAGAFGYDAPMGDGKKNKGNKFYDEANDHQNMMAKSWPKNK